MEVFEKIFYGTGFGRDRMSLARAAYLLLIWVLVPGWLVMRFYSLLVGLAFTGAFAMLSERMDAEITFRHPFFTWTGDVGFEDLSVRPRNPDPARPMNMQVRRVRFDLPNLGVMQGVLTSAGSDRTEEDEVGMLKVVDRLDHIGLHIEGMKFDSLGGLPGVVDQVGAASAAPLEAEGCVGDTLWRASELPKLGIVNEGIDLQLTLANAPDDREVRVTGELVSPHSSRARFAQHFRAPSMSAFLDAETGSRIATYERLEIEDDGFVQARDAYCAKRDGIAPEEFRERHLAAVRRLLEADGMRPTNQLESVYRQYLEHGNLVLEARPNGNVRRADYHNYSVEDQSMMYNGKLSAGTGKPVIVRFEPMPSRAIPLAFEGSTWDLVVAESRANGKLPPGAAMVTPTTPAPAPVAPAKPAVVAPIASATARPAVPAATKPAPAAAPAPADVAKAAPKAGEQAPAWAKPPTSLRTTADGRPLASSLPARGSSRRKQMVALSFEQLAQHVGDNVQITTIYGDRRDGRVEGVSGPTLRLRTSAGIGYAVTNFERPKIRSIMILQ